MPSRRPLKGGAPRLLGKHDGMPGRAYRRFYDALEAELGPFPNGLLRFEAGRVAVCMTNLEASTRALAAARRAREQGRGRRPNAQQIERLARRQGLADLTYSQAINHLRELTARNGKAVPSPTALLAATARRGSDGR